MKKICAVILVLIMALAFAACGGDKSSSDDSSSGNVTTGGDVAAGGRVGYYDDDVDHFARDTYDFTYCYTATNAFNDSVISAWERMGKKYNFTLSQMCGENDAEAYVQGIEVACNRGTDGLFIDCDPTISSRVYELLEELEVPYVCILQPLTDEDGHNLAPCVMLDQYRSGYDSVSWYGENYPEYWGEIDETTVALLNINYSTNPALAERLVGSKAAFKEYFPDGAVYEVDGVTVGAMDAEAGYNLTSQIMSAHPEVEHWIIFGCVEDYAQGAARYVETTPNPDSVLITNSGSNLLPLEFESGYDGPWKVCYAVSEISYAGPAACGLIALVDGRATADTLWSDLRAEGDLATNYIADPIMVTIDNYATFKEDMYKLYTE